MRPSHRFPLKLATLCFAGIALVDASAADPIAIAPRLHPIDWQSGRESIRARGDAGPGVRSLELWSWRDEVFERIATTRSDPDGAFDFGEVPVPAGALWLDVTVRGDVPSVDRLLRIERPPAAPIISAVVDGSISEIRIHPAVREGELRVRDARSGVLIDRWPVTTRAPGRAPFDWTINSVSGDPIEFTVEQVLEDGRVSPPAFYRFEARSPSD